MKKILSLLCILALNVFAFAADVIPAIPKAVVDQIAAAKAAGKVVISEGKAATRGQQLAISFADGTAGLYNVDFQYVRGLSGFSEPVLTNVADANDRITINQEIQSDRTETYKNYFGFNQRNGTKLFIYAVAAPNADQEWSVTITWGEGATYQKAGIDTTHADEGTVSGGGVVTPPTSSTSFSIVGIKKNAGGEIELTANLGVDSGDLYLESSSNLKDWEDTSSTAEVLTGSTDSMKVVLIKPFTSKVGGFGPKRFFRIKKK